MQDCICVLTSYLQQFESLGGRQDTQLNLTTPGFLLNFVHHWQSTRTRTDHQAATLPRDPLFNGERSVTKIIAESLGGQQQLTFTCRRFRKVCRRRSTPSARSCDSFLIWKRSRARRAFCYQNATKLKSGVSASSLKGWWTWSGSNRRPLPCHGSALPAAPQAHATCSAISILTYPERTVKHQTAKCQLPNLQK